MILIDAHLHVGLAKYRPVEDFLPVMARFGVDKAVLVQYMWNYDNTYLSECLRRFPGRFAAIGCIDWNQADALPRLDHWVTERAIVGFRLPPTARSAGADPYAIWARLEELGAFASITATAVTATDALTEASEPEFEQIVRRFPRLKFRLEHLGWYPDVTEAPPYESYRRFLRLADYPNIYTTWSAFYDFSREQYPYKDTHPFLKLTYEAFGPQRIMWGTDWPLIEGQEGYDKALDFARHHLPVQSDEDLEWILGRTAVEFYDFARRPVPIF